MADSVEYRPATIADRARRVKAKAGADQSGETSLFLEAVSARRSSSDNYGWDRSSRLSVFTMVRATATRMYGLESAGMAYQGAKSREVRRSASW